MLTTYKEEYLKDPCRVSSLPYWKSVGMRLPENLLVVHEERMGDLDLSGYMDEPYFRLKPKFSRNYQTQHRKLKK